MIFNNERIPKAYNKYTEVSFSLLFKSLRSGNEKLALYAAEQIKSVYTLKMLLIIFMCENCPMIYMIKSFIDLNISTINELKPWIIRLCRITKTRIVINAFRVVSFENYKQSPDKPLVSIQDIKTINDGQLLMNPSVDVEQEKALIKNTYIIWQLLCQNGIKQTMNDIFTNINNYDKQIIRVLRYIYKFINKRYLDVIFLYLSYVSIVSYSRSSEYLNENLKLDTIRQELNLLSSSADTVDIPDSVYDMYTPSNKRSNLSYEFYFKNLVINPSLPLTKTDKFGIQKFISIHKPLESSIVEYVKAHEIKNIYLARLQNFKKQNKVNLALFTTNKLKPRYKKLIYLISFQQKETIRQYIYCDYLKSRLGLNSLNRQIIIHDGKNYMIQNNIFPVLDDGYFQKNSQHQTVYIYPVESFIPNQINLYTSDEELLLKIMEMLIFHHIIGHSSFERYSVIIYENQVYSLTDRVQCFYQKTFFILSISTQAAEAFKRVLDQHWVKILKILKHFHKVIASDMVVNINMKMLILYHIEQLKDKNNWIFNNCNSSNTNILSY